MTSSFAAQQHGSRNPHQSPVRSHKGGYIRCPFNISASYAELAEKRVREDLARGGRGKTAVADKDGLSTSSAPSDGLDGDSEGRPWSRAGVGAKKLSGKEKRLQQEQAELIYGRGSLAGADDGNDTPGAAASQENMFAVDARDQAALQQVVPRAVREKVKRRKFEELKKERRPLGQSHHARTSSAAASAGNGVQAPASVRDSDEEEEVRRGSRLAPTTELAHPYPVPAHRGGTESNTAAHARAAGAGSATTATAPVVRSSNAAPAAPPNRLKNRMQMLNDLRSAALTGKKRRR